MHRFRSILFSPLAHVGNPAAARRVRDLAVRNGATVTMLGSVPEPSRLQRMLQRAEHLDALQAAERESLSAKLSRCFPDRTGIDVATRVTSGDPALRIVEEVLRAGHDLVVVTVDDETPRATVNRLFRKCSCPVWVIRPSRARVHRVLAAVDPDPSQTDINRAILELAASMNELHGGELHLAHTWELYGEATMRHSAFMRMSAADLQALLEEEAASHRAAIDELLSVTGRSGDPWQIHLRQGRASAVLPELVARHRINLLVMGTVARDGVGGLIIGNTAEAVLDGVRCSVLAVKPPGFVSPIRLADT